MRKALILRPFLIDAGLQYAKIEVPFHSRHDSAGHMIEIIADIRVMKGLAPRRPGKGPGKGRKKRGIHIGAGSLHERLLGRKGVFELLELGTVG